MQKKETNSTYLVRQLGILCGKCAKEYGNDKINKLKQNIKELQNNIGREKIEIDKAIQVDCKHDFVDSHYSVMRNGVAKNIYYCPHCELEIER